MAFKSYCLTDRRTDTTTSITHAALQVVNVYNALCNKTDSKSDAMFLCRYDVYVMKDLFSSVGAVAERRLM